MKLPYAYETITGPARTLINVMFALRLTTHMPFLKFPLDNGKIHCKFCDYK